MSNPAPTRPPAPKPAGKEHGFALACGLWIAITLLKFGNPVIFGDMITSPRNFAEFVFTSWPVAWGYLLLVVVALISIPGLQLQFVKRHHWPAAVLGFWLVWQFLSGAQSIAPRLSHPTLIHFLSVGASFLLGWWALSRWHTSPWFWTPVLVSFLYVLFNGFDQHAGGLEATRKAFYEQPNWQSYPRDYLLRIQSDRIFSTLVYPNAFAGLLLLLFPAVLYQAWVLTERWPRVLRGVFAGLIAYLGIACFYWTGSKGGWLIALALAGVYALTTRIPARWKAGLIAAGLVLGLTLFFIRFSAYFERGATSVGARFGYWTAAVQIAKMHPILGTGPGTFSVLFSKLKPPEAEMAKLVHNDYLEQACDSGLPGALAYCLAIGAMLVKLRPTATTTRLDTLLWLGLLGWALQGFIEFGLYIPALAWPAFLLFGTLLGRRP